MQLRLGYIEEGQDKAFTQMTSFDGNDLPETPIENASYFSWESSDGAIQQKIAVLKRLEIALIASMVITTIIYTSIELALEFAADAIFASGWYGAALISSVAVRFITGILLIEYFALLVYRKSLSIKHMQNKKLIRANAVILTLQPLTEEEQARHCALGIAIPPIGYTAHGNLPLQRLEEIYRNIILEEGYEQRSSNLWTGITNRPIANHAVAEFCRNWHDTARLADALPNELDDACRRTVQHILNA